MEINKKKLTEIIDSNSDLIGSDAIPKYGSDLESQANGTTDQNAKIAQQPYRSDMLGRFGFSMMPFMEGEEKNVEDDFLNELDELLWSTYENILKYYYKNPNKLKSDYRKISNDDKNVSVGNGLNSEEIVGLINKMMKRDKSNKIDEGVVYEDKVIEKDSNKSELTKKTEDNEVRDKKLEKIAGMINKLDKKEVNKIINLLERK